MAYTMAAPAISRAPDGRSACAEIANLVSSQEVKWTWSCRTLKADRRYRLLGHESATPRVGDVALVEVVEVGQHTRLSTRPDAKQRLYQEVTGVQAVLRIRPGRKRGVLTCLHDFCEGQVSDTWGAGVLTGASLWSV